MTDYEKSLPCRNKEGQIRTLTAHLHKDAITLTTPFGDQAVLNDHEAELLAGDLLTFVEIVRKGRQQ
ncbi:hypothetical protein LWC34_29430 [Kibdelosporangium philippinense]|uniref:DUF397 domain-containing protein n=1 Tax=Kibdelosporangium philippinense TaxID=211113 RepID=A0ABS8ZGH1_9PSEU|nr:hypothetical protein [Kibdelosporangium philippinense]MCE7006919.1 hypothetical protein [Kibdelosporangium philippinense]